MNEYPFQFAVLRYIHDTLTQEFINVGVVVYSKESRYIKTRVSQRYSRISKAFQGINGQYYRRLVGHVERSFSRMHHHYQSEQLEQLDDFPPQIEIALQQVLPPDDSSLVFGGIGGGLTDDLDAELDRLYCRLVERYIEREELPSREDKEVWQFYRQELEKHDIPSHLRPVTITTPNYEYEFEHAWKNERWHPIEALSFDLVHPTSIREKGTQWIGRAISLADSDELGTLYLLLGGPPRYKTGLRNAYEKALQNMRGKMLVSQLHYRLIEEDDAPAFSEELAQMINGHRDS
jgi:hypothetical protein